MGDTDRIKILLVLLVGVFMLFVLGLAPITVAGEHQDGAINGSSGVEIDPEVQELTGEQQVIVRLEPLADSQPSPTELQAHAERTQGSVLTQIDSIEGVTVENRLWIVNGLVVTVNGDDVGIEQIARIDGVNAIHANPTLTLDYEMGEVTSETHTGMPSFGTRSFASTVSTDTSWALDQIGAPDAWTEYGTKGGGVKVAVLDTGIEVEHDDLELYTEDASDPTYPGGWTVIDSFGAPKDNPGEPFDNYGHGTATSGSVIAGDGGGQYQGVAPNADLLHANVGPSGSSSFSRIAGGIEWAIENNADVISISWGSEGYDSRYIDPIRNAQNSGVSVAVSVGNSGDGTSTSPGNDYDSISVGASEIDRDIATFSSGERIVNGDTYGSSAPSDWPDAYTVPKVVAPGRSVETTVPGNGYAIVDGTSFAAPNVAGAIALVISATDGNHTPEEIQQALVETASHPDGDNAQDTRYGYGIIDVYAAIEYLQSGSDPAPSFSVVGASLDTSTILEGESVTVSADIENSGDADGTFTAELQEDGTTVATTDVTVAAGSTETVTFTRTYNTAGTYDLAVSGTSAGTLTVEQPATFGITGTSLSSSTITEGESVTVDATVENTGDRDGQFTAGLLVDGSVAQTTTVTITAGTSKTVSFDETFTTPGDYAIDVNNTAVGTLTVEEATAAFTVSGASLSTSTILEGDTAEATATVENTGDASGEFTAEFTLTDGDGGTTTRDTATVSLGAGESTTVTLADTVGAAGSYNAAVSGASAGTLTVEQPASFTVTGASLSSSTITEGESVTVSADVENTGDRDGTFTAELQQDGTTVATTDVTVPAGSTETVTFTRTYNTAGTYDLAVSGTTAGTLTVEEATAAFTVSGASLTDTTILEGDTAEATATVENTGDATGEFTAEFRLTDGNGQTTTRDSTTVSLAAGGSTTVTLADTVGTAGTYDAEVSGASAGTLTVDQPATFGITGTSLSSSTITEGESVTVDATVENTGDRDGQFTAGLLVDGSVAQTTTVTVTAGTSTTVSFDETFTTPGDYVIDVNSTAVDTLTVEEATAAFTVSGASLSDSTILEGDTAEATATVENTGDASGEFTAEFRLTDGNGQTTTHDTQTVSLAAGQSTTVTLADTVGTAGSYDAEVSGESAGTLQVDQPATFGITGTSLSSGTITEGESVTVSADVENTGDRDGTFTAELQQDGTTVATTDVPVAAGSTETVTFTESYNTAGTYDLAVSGTTAGTLTVDEATAAFTVSGASLTDTTILEGGTAKATATVENTGDASGEFTAEFRLTDANGQTTTRDTTTVTLAAGQSTTVTLTDTVATAGTYDADVSGEPAGTLTVDQPATFGITGTSLSSSTITEGKSVTVDATVENTGDQSGTFTAELEVDGSVVQSQDVQVSGGSTEQVTFTETFTTAGDYSVSVSSEPAGTLTVLQPANIAVTSASLSSSEVVEGRSVDVTATVENTGDRDGTFAAELQQGGTTVATTDVPVAAGSTETVTFTETYNTAGTYDLAVSGTTAGTLTVEQPPSFAVIDASLARETIDEDESVDVTATVENTGDRAGTFTAELLVDGTQESTADVEVASGGTATVTFTEVFGNPGEYTIDVNEARAGTLTVEETVAEFAVSGASMTDETILEGETAEATATVENVGSAEGQFTAGLRLTGSDGQTTTRDTATVTLAAGESTTVSLADAVETAGTYDAAVSGEPAGTLTVEQPASFAVTDTRLGESTILEGESVTVSADVENTGDRDGQFEADLFVDGAVAGTTTVTVPAGTTETVRFDESFDTAGEYTIAVNDAAVGTLTVEEATAEFVVSDATLTDDSILEGETAEVTATVENVGNADGEVTAEFRLRGAPTTVRDTQTVSLGAGQSTTVTLADTVGTAGTYDAEVSGEPAGASSADVSGASAGTLTVESPADLAVTDAALQADSIAAGESVEVGATVENTGDRTGTTTVELRVDGEVRQTTEAEVAGGTTETLTFEPTFREAGEYAVAVNDARAGTLSVESADPAEFAVSEAVLDDATILAGDTAQVSATVENVGDASGTYTATFRADGGVVDSVDVTLAAGESKRVDLTATFDDAGTYDVTVSGADAGTLVVDRPATFAVTSADLDAHTITVEERATVTASVENVGDRDGTHEVTLVENGEAVATKTASVSAGGTRTVTFERTYDQPGTYDLAVDDTAAGTLTVTEANPAAFAISGVTAAAGSVSAGESVEITATVTNTGEERGTAPVRLLIDGVERDAAELTLDATETRTVRLQWEPGADDAGEYTAAVESPTDSATTPVTVRGPPTFAVEAPDANAPVTAGEELQVEATVENTGWNGTQRVRLLVNGTERGATEMALDGGESTTVTLSWDTEAGDAGTYDLVVASGTANATVTARVTPANEEGPPPVVGEEPPQDLSGDGVYEDVDGDGEFTVGDVQQFFQHRDSKEIQDNPEFFDLTGDGQVSVGDVQRLFMEFMAAS